MSAGLALDSWLELSDGLRVNSPNTPEDGGGLFIKSCVPCSEVEDIDGLCLLLGTGEPSELTEDLGRKRTDPEVSVSLLVLGGELLGGDVEREKPLGGVEDKEDSKLCGNPGDNDDRELTGIG